MGWIVLFGFGQNEVAVADALSPTESLIVSRLTTIAEGVVLTEALRRTVNRSVGDIPGFTESLGRQVTRRIAETAALTESLTKHIARVVAQAESVSFVEGLQAIKVAPMAVQDTLSATESLGRSVNRRLADATGFVEAIGRTIARRLSDALSSGEDLTTLAGVALTDALGVTEQVSWLRVSLVNMAEALLASEAIRRDLSRRLTEQVQMVEQVVTQTIGGVIAAIPQRVPFVVSPRSLYAVPPRNTYVVAA